MLKNVYKVPNGKLLKISLEKEGNKIRKITITGDFFAYPEDCIEKIENELVGKELEEEKLESAIRNIIITNDFKIFGFDKTSLTTAIIRVNEAKKFRLLLTNYNTGAMNMAIDEAILNHVSAKKVPTTVRFYGWKPPAITIGYFQSMKEEVDIERCKKSGVDFIRRITGGGAVFHENEVTYSIIAQQDYFSNDILASYRQICQGIINGLKRLNLDTIFVPLNDIIVNGRKISGNAQTRKMKCILQHGTVLIDVDVKKMFSLLRIPDEKIKDKLIKNASERVTSINKETGKNNSFDEVIDVLVAGFKEALNAEFEQGELTHSEKEMAEKLAKEKYAKDEWNFRR